ncbi:MAG TPA: peptidylprolyl isomerase [Gemmatimonadales bacterium]|jgi:peptidyl-prolyl cis-trans isomerase SurA|nr:peptidylprolyl isomerase [Gemmatimonadales bacterium]
MTSRSIILAAVLAGATAPLQAQDSTSFALHGDTTFVVDRIVAVVGNEPILQSQVDEQVFTVLSGNPNLKLGTATDTARMRAQVRDQMINEELMVQAARRDTAVKVTDQDVNAAVDQLYKQARGRFSSEVDFQRELHQAGFASVDEYRRFLADRQRRELLRQGLIARLKETRKLKPVNPTESEMRAAFEEGKTQLGERPATVSFRQIVIAPRASEAARARAFQLADSIAKALREGGDFATAAKRFSQDPGSKDQGGDLGWTRRGLLDPKFEAAALSLKPGMISNPVETSFGVHVIQLERTEPTAIHARHILIIPETTPANVDSARAFASRVADSLRSGASFDSLQARFHDASEEKVANDVPVDQLPPVYAQAVANADSGQVVGPFDLTGPDGKLKFAILDVTARRAAGEIVYSDVKDQLRTNLAENLATQRYLDHLRQSTYIDIRTP